MLDAKPTLVSIFLKFANEVDADHLDDASVEPFLIGAISAIDPEDYPERVTDSFGECYYEGGTTTTRLRLFPPPPSHGVLTPGSWTGSTRLWSRRSPLSRSVTSNGAGCLGVQ